LGATLLTGLVGNVSIPRQATATQTYWVSEGDAITQSEGTFDNVMMSPKVLGTRSTYTRLMLQQSTPDIEAVIRNDLAMGLALELDRVALVGTGTNNQPLGVLNQPSIPTHAMGATGAAFVNSSASVNSGIDPLIELEGLVAASNAPVNGSWGYVTNSRVTASLRKLKTSGDFSYLRDVGPLTSSGSGPIIMGTGLPQAPMRINGYPLFSTNSVPSNLTKSTGTNLSAVLFGVWSELLIGLWGALEIVANPYGSDDFARGNVSIRAMLTCDIAVKHTNSFAVIKDVVA
jgi:HK97 family phage major capsid protein